MRTLALMAMIVLGGCAGTRVAQAPANVDRDVETRAVYEAVLRHMWLRDGIETLVLDPQSTGATGEAPRIRQEFGRVQRDTLRDYQSCAQLSERLPTELDVGVPVEWFTNEAFRAYLSEAEAAGEPLPLEAAWDRVRRRYVKWSGWVSLGTVGLSAAGREALVDTGVGSAGLSASWHVVLLRKRGDRWVVVAEYMSAMA